LCKPGDVVETLKTITKYREGIITCQHLKQSVTFNYFVYSAAVFSDLTSRPFSGAYLEGAIALAPPLEVKNVLILSVRKYFELKFEHF